MITFAQFLQQAQDTYKHHNSADISRCMIYDLFTIVEQQNTEIKDLKSGLEQAHRCIEKLRIKLNKGYKVLDI